MKRNGPSGPFGPLGQYIIIEAVIIFTMGIFIAISLANIFGDFRKTSRLFSEENQAKLLTSFFLAKITEISNMEEGYIEFEIPKNIAGSGYVVTMSDNKIGIISQNKAYISKFMGLESYIKFKGTVSSNFRKAKLEIKNNTIELEGV